MVVLIILTKYDHQKNSTFHHHMDFMVKLKDWHSVVPTSVLQQLVQYIPFSKRASVKQILILLIRSQMTHVERQAVLRYSYSMCLYVRECVASV